jgi:hypothetical protein
MKMVSFSPGAIARIREQQKARQGAGLSIGVIIGGAAVGIALIGSIGYLLLTKDSGNKAYLKPVM